MTASQNRNQNLLNHLGLPNNHFRDFPVQPPSGRPAKFDGFDVGRTFRSRSLSQHIFCLNICHLNELGFGFKDFKNETIQNQKFKFTALSGSNLPQTTNFGFLLFHES